MSWSPFPDNPPLYFLTSWSVFRATYSKSFHRCITFFADLFLCPTAFTTSVIEAHTRRLSALRRLDRNLLISVSPLSQNRSNNCISSTSLNGHFLLILIGTSFVVSILVRICLMWRRDATCLSGAHLGLLCSTSILMVGLERKRPSVGICLV